MSEATADAAIAAGLAEWREYEGVGRVLVALPLRKTRQPNRANGGRARARALSAERRREIAQGAARARWGEHATNS